MIQITAQIDNELDAVARKQLPYAAMLALNSTAFGAQGDVKGNLPKRFKLRNQWTARGITVDKASKQTLTAKVNAPDYMAIQETGGERHPLQSRMLAAPAQAMQNGRTIPRTRKPKALLADGKAFILGMKNGDAGVFKRYGRKRGQITLLYWLTDEQHYEERFHFVDDIEAHTKAHFSENLASALDKALGK